MINFRQLPTGLSRRGVARVITRGLLGPRKIYIMHFVSVFSFHRGLFLGQRAVWHSELNLYNKIKRFSIKIIFSTMCRKVGGLFHLKQRFNSGFEGLVQKKDVGQKIF